MSREPADHENHGGTEKVGQVTRAQLEEIAEVKMQDLNTTVMDSAIKMLAGTARSMGIEVVG